MTDMHFIKGATSAGTSGRSQNVYNPATGAVTSSVPLASAAEIDAAVAVAKAALPGWANTPPAKRAQVLPERLVMAEPGTGAAAAVLL